MTGDGTEPNNILAHALLSPYALPGTAYFGIGIGLAQCSNKRKSRHDTHPVAASRSSGFGSRNRELLELLLSSEVEVGQRVEEGEATNVRSGGDQAL